MKHIKLLFATCLIAALSFSCGKDDGDPEPTELQTCLSKTITSSSTTTFHYDENNRAISSEVEFSSSPLNNYSSAYTYNSSGQLTEWLITNTTSTRTKLLYFYNSSGQISKIETYLVSPDGTSTPDRETVASYATPGKIRVLTTPFGGSSYLETDYFIDAKGNIIKQQTYSPAGMMTTTSEYRSFDDKNSPSLSTPRTSFARNVNNYLDVTITSHDTGGVSTGTYTYEYNPEGYPTKRTTNTGSITTYEYIKK